MPALRCPHVPREGQGAGEGALADPGTRAGLRVLSGGDDPRAAGERIEHLLAELRAGGDPRAAAVAEELLRLVTDLYGAGLARVVELARRECPELLARLGTDDLVGALLVLHDLHPDDLSTRVAAALDSVRPLLAQHGGDVELLAIDADAGAVLLRLLGSCHGCPSSTVTLRHAVEAAIARAAPEIAYVDVEEEAPATAVPVTLRAGPSYELCPTEVEVAP